jgi:hypothetical protein
MKEVEKLLDEIESKIEGKIDGHSWGIEQTGVSKIDISDLEEIQEWIAKLKTKLIEQIKRSAT